MKLRFVFSVLLGALFVSVDGPCLGAQRAERLPGGKLEWTRLVTPSQYWKRHSETDRRLLEFLARETPLEIERQWRATSAKSMEELCHYPFVYAHDISHLSRAEARNLAEYLKRGGFLFVDFCANVKINPAPRVFLQRQFEMLDPHVPDLRVEQLPPEHEVFSVYFKMTKFPPQTRPGDSAWVDGATNPLCALFSGERLIGIVGLSAFQCAWSGVGAHANAVECMQMVANIYIYAMTR